MKRRLKLFISVAVRVWDVSRTALLRLFGRKPQSAWVVLYYHAVPAQQRELFARQMDVLLKVARPISTNSPSTLEPGVRYAAVTFDDGFASVMENAAPELKSRQIPWTIFVPSGCLGQSPAWLRNAPPAARQDRVMTANELRALASDPLVTVGSHTVTHPNLLKLDDATVERELKDSKSCLEAMVGRPVTLFSFPYGAYDDRLAALAKSAGYERVFTIEPECVRGDGARFVAGRVAAEPTDWPLEFRLKLLGAYRWLAKRS